jgi:DNA mismatch repair protein MSH4
LGFNAATGGYYLIANANMVSETNLPSLFINAQRNKKSVTFTTLDLLKLNERIKESATEITLMSDEYVFAYKHRIPFSTFVHL